MTCERCGSRCKGRKCARCEQHERVEKLHGRPNDDVGSWRDDDSVVHPDSDEWSIEQQSLEGDEHSGQATLDGGVVKEVHE